MKGFRFSWKYAFIIAGLVAVVYLVTELNSRMAELRENTVLKEQVAVEATGLMQTQLALKTQIGFATSEAAVEQWAYEDAHMVRPGDNPVVPIAPPGATPVPTPTPQVTREVVENRQIWLWLFLDQR